MLLKLIAFLSVLGYLSISTDAFVRVGLIHKKGDKLIPSIVEEGLKISQGGQHGDIQLVKEEASEEDTRSYHQALCRLLSSKIDAFISPASSPYYSMLNDYASERQIPFITAELPQSISLTSNNFSFGMSPITTRAILRLIRIYNWKDIIYLYDHDDGPENLNFMFTVGTRVLSLNLIGMLKVTHIEDASRYFQSLDRTLTQKSFHVILDTDPFIAHEIIRRHVNDIRVRKMNFHFVLSKPITESLWNSQVATFGAVNVTAFTIKRPHHGEDVFTKLPEIDNGQKLNIYNYYYYDAAEVLLAALRKVNGDRRGDPVYGAEYGLQQREEPVNNCLENLPTPSVKGAQLARFLKETKRRGTTGHIEFENGQRTNFDINIVESSSRGYNAIGRWSKGNFLTDSSSTRNIPVALPLIQTNGKLKIVTKIKPPYMMLKTVENGTALQGNDRFEGFCKDLIILLAEQVKFEYEIYVVEDGTYGEYDKSKGRWTGIIGDIIEGKADLAVADLIITGQRQRVVDFTDPFEMAGLSLVMKNPLMVSRLSSILFFLSAFTIDVWICALFAIILFCVLFHLITKFTGAPDSIESASGIWGRKHLAIVNLWFVMGSSMFQSTGVYPRSISSRILSGFCWFFTFMLSSLFIASITVQVLTGRQADENNPQFSQLKALSLESIISESVSRGWPKIGLIESSNAENFMEKSNLPIYVEFAKYLQNNPDVKVTSPEDGIKRVQESNGDYMVLLESLVAEYASGRKPCDVVATHDAVHYAGYGMATPLGSTLVSEITTAFHIIQDKGALGHLHRKWWIDRNECKNFITAHKSERTTHVFSGLMCVSAVGFLILLGVFIIQYIRRNQNKESRRQQLTFEDMNLEQNLPTPPPELLVEPAPVILDTYKYSSNLD